MSLKPLIGAYADSAGTWNIVANGANNDSPGITAAFGGPEIGWIAQQGGQYLIEWDAVMPAGKILLIEPGCTFRIRNGATLYLMGEVDLPQERQVFILEGSGKVVGLRSLTPEMLGAQAGNANDAYFIQQAHNCLEASGAALGGPMELRLLSREYKLHAPVFLRPTQTFSLTLRGAGVMNDGTRLVASSDAAHPWSGQAGQALVNLTATALPNAAGAYAEARIESLGLVWNAGACATALRLSGGDPLKANVLQDVFIQDFEVGLHLSKARMWSVQRFGIWAENRQNAIGCLIDGGGGDCTFHDGQISMQLAAGSRALRIAASTGEWVAGLRFNGVVFYHPDRGVEIQTTGSGKVGDVWFNPGCQFDGDNTVAGTGTPRMVALQADGGAIDNVNFNGAYFSGFAALQPAVEIAATGTGAINDVSIVANWFVGFRGPVINAFNANGLIVANNRFREVNTTTMLQFSLAKRIVVSGNTLFQGATATLTNSVQIEATCDDFVVADNVFKKPINNLAGTSASRILANNV